MAGFEREREQEQERERLGGVYGEMSDGELLALEGSSGDLTEAAQGVLRGEMGRRGLEALRAEAGLPETEAGEGAEGWRTLHVFSQTFEAQAAFRLMERDGIEFAVEDRSVDARGQPVAGPAVQLALIVRGVEWERAVRLLRREAGLFPEAVVDPRGSAMEGEDDGEMWSVVGDFEEEEALVKAERMLGEAEVGLRVVRGEMAGGEAGSIEVREVDVDRAIAVLERLIAEEDE